MNSKAKTPRPERAMTDESLRTERKNTDQVLEDRRTRVEETADEIVERAREQADAVLDTARDKADDKLETGKAGAPARHAVAKERAEEDQALQDEREAADVSLRGEREEQARTLAALLPLEREKTDRFLLTERARSDDAVANRDDFMGIVSHDLRSLLGGVAGQVMLLSRHATDSDEGRRTVAGMERIQRYVARMNRLIGDLVDVASIDAGRLAVHPQRGDAAVLVAEAVDAFAHAAREKRVALKCVDLEPSLSASFDHDRMLQVLANLVANAIRFTEPDGVIAIGGERAHQEVRLWVRDTGPGIPPDMLEAVFERFWQVGKNDHRGLGLGLYISKCIVEAHGGQIWAESKLGAGSAFYFTIPVLAEDRSTNLHA